MLIDSWQLTCILQDMENIVIAGNSLIAADRPDLAKQLINGFINETDQKLNGEKSKVAASEVASSDKKPDEESLQTAKEIIKTISEKASEENSKPKYGGLVKPRCCDCKCKTVDLNKYSEIQTWPYIDSIKVIDENGNQD